MEKQTTLRLPENLTLNTELSNRICDVLGNVKIERYDHTQDLKSHYERRINVLQEAFLFITENIPFSIDAQAIQKYLRWCKDYCALPSQGSIEDYQKLLIQYTALLVNALVDYYPWTINDVKEYSKIPSKPIVELDFKTSAIEILNKAEQYFLMKMGRNDLATLIPLKINHTFEWVLLWEKQLTPFTEKTLEELKEINKLESFTTPKWFRELSFELQIYLHTFQLDIPQLIVTLDKFSLKWLKIKAEKGNQLEIDLKALSEGATMELTPNLEKEEKKLIEIFAECALSVNKIDSLLESLALQLNNLNLNQNTNINTNNINTTKFNSPLIKDEIQTIRKLPYWFLLLEEFEQHFLKSVLRSRKDEEELISFLPSRLRRIPMLANFCEHRLCFISKNAELIKEYKPRLRSSHLASRDVLNLPPTVGHLHASQNLKKILSFLGPYQVMLLQTLISPINILGKFIPDSKLEKQLKRTVQWVEKESNNPIFTINHPLNLAKIVSFTRAGESSCNDLLDHGKQYLISEFLKNNPTDPNGRELMATEIENNLSYLAEKFQSLDSKNKDLMMLLNEYYEVLNSPYGSATILDHYGRELFLSSLEHLIIIYLGGKSYGSCVSGKDRKQIEILHTDAMLIYREKYDRWPSLKDVGHYRTRFINLVATLYISKHIHEHAGQNAPGADGIKTPEKYWPGDIAGAIRKKLESQESLGIDDVLATNNEVSRIGKKMLHVKQGFTICLNAALRLSPESTKKVIDALSILSEERPFWGTQGRFFSSPTGIYKIQKLLNTPLKNETLNDKPQCYYRLAKIYFELIQRPKESSGRKGSTKTVYAALLKLYEAQYPEREIFTVLDQLEEIKQRAFQYNLRYNTN